MTSGSSASSWPGPPRRIEAFTRDDEGVWVAQLDCGHRRHIRHRPPMAMHPWVESEAGRSEHLGTPIECGRCAQHLWPDGLAAYKVTPEFDAHNVPAGLLADHRTRRGAWGRLEVLEGRVALHFAEPDGHRVNATPELPGIIPPELPHHVEPDGPARFRVRFYRRSASDTET